MAKKCVLQDADELDKEFLKEIVDSGIFKFYLTNVFNTAS